jgi:hypothetical protein
MYIHRNKKKGFQELKVWEAISVSSFQWVYGGDDKKILNRMRFLASGISRY